LTSLNAHYIRVADERVLADDVLQRLHKKLDGRMVDAAQDRIVKGLPGLRERARTLVELADNAAFYAIDAPIPMNAEADRLLTQDNRRLLADVASVLADPSDWTDEALEERVRRFAAERQPLKLRDIAQPLRAALTGSTVSPPVFQVMAVLGRAETLERLAAVKDPGAGNLQ
jgi:glutamyl-tRNA synthetase